MTVALPGLPQDNNSSFLTGPVLAPGRIREAVHCESANMFSEKGHDLGAGGLWKDVALADLSGCAAFEAIHARVSGLIAERHSVLSMGGDHSVAYPAILTPGVSHFEPGGMTTRDVLSIIQGVKGTLIGADIVELNPHRDPYGMTAMVAAKIVKELIGRLINDSEQAT